jgi:hypothetical protein
MFEFNLKLKLLKQNSMSVILIKLIKTKLLIGTCFGTFILNKFQFKRNFKIHLK